MNHITINGVRGYIDENGTAQLNLEDVSRGLGFTQTAASGNEVIRWERVNKYLSELGFIPTSGDGYIPENIFYRLAMKAKNEVAESFQAKVADEILPSIRKTGSYSVQQSLPQNYKEALLTLVGKVEENERLEANNLQLANIIETDKPKVQFAETCMTSDKSILVREVAKLASKQGVMIGEKRLFQKLRDWGMILQSRTEPTQHAMEMGLFEIKKGVYAHPEGARDYATAKVTVKGQMYIINRLLKDAA